MRKELSNIKGVIILLGLPGAGKGTQAQLISEKLQIPCIKIGDILREMADGNDQFGQKIKNLMANGSLMDNKFLAQIIDQYTLSEKFGFGFVVDGYPRNIEQAMWFDRWVAMRKMKSLALFLSVQLDTIKKRILARRVCRKCNETYNIYINPTICDSIECFSCAGELMCRADDNIEAIEKRISVYNSNTTPVVSFYRKKGCLIEIDGECDVNIVFENLMESYARFSVLLNK